MWRCALQFWPVGPLAPTHTLCSWRSEPLEKTKPHWRNAQLRGTSLWNKALHPLLVKWMSGGNPAYWPPESQANHFMVTCFWLTGSKYWVAKAGVMLPSYLRTSTAPFASLERWGMSILLSMRRKRKDVLLCWQWGERVLEVQTDPWRSYTSDLSLVRKKKSVLWSYVHILLRYPSSVNGYSLAGVSFSLCLLSSHHICPWKARDLQEVEFQRRFLKGWSLRWNLNQIC